MKLAKGISQELREETEGEPEAVVSEGYRNIKCLILTVEPRRNLLGIDVQDEISTIITLLPLQLGVLLDSSTGSLTSCRFDRPVDTV